jgi:hypothetical protein
MGDELNDDDDDGPVPDRKGPSSVRVTTTKILSIYELRRCTAVVCACFPCFTVLGSRPGWIFAPITLTFTITITFSSRNIICAYFESWMPFVVSHPIITEEGQGDDSCWASPLTIRKIFCNNFWDVQVFNGRHIPFRIKYDSRSCGRSNLHYLQLIIASENVE